MNLTAVRDPVGIAIRHVVDSLTAVRFLRERAVTGVIDLGSGAGFPGLPLAAVLPLGQTVLVESVGKKARFLAAVADATGVGDHVRVVPARAETLSAREMPERSAVVARGVAPLGELIELAFPLLRANGPLVAWKSASAIDGPDDELAAARRAIVAIDPDARLETQPAIPAIGAIDSDAAADSGAEALLAPLRDHRLVIVTRSESRIDPIWPRDPAQRRRRPW
jgi:16S rRNA (guanine527-N7)-methyltransferase